MPTGQKHLVTCRCVLPQFKRHPNPPPHQFVAFSVINDDDSVKHKFVQCPNCGIVHKVIEISRSEIITSRESMPSMLSIEDIKCSIPENLANVLVKANADLPTWEAVQFILENKQWGNFAVISTDTEGEVKQGKYVRILGDKLFKVESFVRS